MGGALPCVRGLRGRERGAGACGCKEFQIISGPKVLSAENKI